MKFQITVTIEADDWATADNARHEMASRAGSLLGNGSVQCQSIHFAEVEHVHDELDKLYVAAARDEHHKDGEIEIDDGAAVSYGENKGAYVAAWVWVDESPTIASAREEIEAIEDRRAELADSEGGHCD